MDPRSAAEQPRGSGAATGVLLVQLGTPDAPTAPALRRYLREFLGDPRVVELPRLAWTPILYGFVLPLRPARSARKYAAIWTDEGSPLLVYTRRQAKLLRGAIGERGHEVEVVFAMRYGTPSIASVLRELRARGLERLLVVPLYPQYSASTTATVFDAIARELRGWRVQPALRFVRDFHDDDRYIEALARRVRAHREREGCAERLLMSFHGVPRRVVALGDPYESQCRATAARLAQRLGLADDQWMATFQSRFGPAEWLQPYTAPTLVELARRGVASVDVVCPGFVADCLETLEEISIEARQSFLDAGGRSFSYIAALNDSPSFIDALASIVERNLQGWTTSRASRP
ncbi:MAG: ferrochelatase [Burkholderiaceae bacterium]|nr:ferrochelatase [Burkholderiaceae bacterium]